MLGGANDAPALGQGHAASGTAMVTVSSGADLDKHQGAVGLEQDQVDLGAGLVRPAGQSLIAAQQAQALLLQMRQRQILGAVTNPLGAEALRLRNLPNATVPTLEHRPLPADPGG